MACNAITSITKGCEVSNSGGIYSIAIQDTANVAYTADTTGCTMTALSASPKFQLYEFNRNVGSANVSQKTDLIAGSTYFEGTITIVLNRHTAAKHAAIQVLGAGQRFLDIIVKDAAGNYRYYDHCQLTGNETTTGTAKADGQKYTLTFVTQMDNMPVEVSAAQYAANV